MSLIPNSRGGALWRFALAAVIVVLFTAASVAVAGLLQFKQLASDISGTPAIQHAAVTIPDPGNPQTILIIGSDHRAGEPFTAANTDTMMLVRLDPNSQTINVLSIPRDLRVTLPGSFVPVKINSAYSAGGPNLLIKTIRQNVFPNLHVNHIVDVNFGGFQALVDAIGCVYTDVDHRYYNNTAFTNYSSIDLQPGYQKLCGADALSFVRFRHTDNDLVRNARQQDFIRWAKDQYGVGNLINNRDKLLKIFGDHVQTDADLHSVDGLINLFNLVAFSAGHTIKQIHFPAIIQPCGGTGPGAVPCFVAADPTAERAVFRQLMTPTKSAPKKPAVAGRGGGRHGGPGKATDLMPDLTDGKAQAAALGRISMPVFVPGQIASGSHYCTATTCTEGPVPNSYPRAYTLHDQSGQPRVSYRLTVVLNPLLGQYYGIQGTTWKTPPILSSPSQTKVVRGKKLLLYSNGGKLGVVAWRTAGCAYWVSNTLTDDLSNQQMVQIAASLARVRG